MIFLRRNLRKTVWWGGSWAKVPGGEKRCIFQSAAVPLALNRGALKTEAGNVANQEYFY